MQSKQLVVIAFGGLAALIIDRPTPAYARKYVVKIPIKVFSNGRVNRSYQSIPVISSKGEMQVKAGDIANDFPLVPAQSLSAALKHDKISKQFRVSWTSFGSDYEIRATAVYNRSTRSMRYFCFDSGGYGDHYSRFYRATLVKGVTDDILHRVGNNRPPERPKPNKPKGRVIYAPNIYTGGFTDYLTLYGARIAWENIRELKRD